MKTLFAVNNNENWSAKTCLLLAFLLDFNFDITNNDPTLIRGLDIETPLRISFKQHLYFIYFYSQTVGRDGLFESHL